MKKLFFLSTFLVVIFSFYFNADCQWVSTGGPPDGNVLWAMTKNSTNLFVSAYGYVMPIGVYTTSNSGTNWSITTYSPKNSYCLAAVNNDVYTGGDSAVYKSDNNGLSWTRFNLPVKTVTALYTIGNNLYVGATATNYISTDGGVYFTSNGGTNWSYLGLMNYGINCFASNSTYLFAGNQSIMGTPIYRTSNNGLNWQEVGTGYSVSCLATVGPNYVFSGGQQGLLRSTNNGGEWWHVIPPTITVRSLLVYNNIIFAGTHQGLYVSYNNGDNWVQKNEGLTSETNVGSLVVLNDYLYAGIYYSKVWRRPLVDFTGITLLNTNVPDKFKLFNNYPNPFNPKTVIKFQLPFKSKVKLVICDLLAREISVLADRTLEPGTYESSFDGSGLSSGVYLCRLSAEKYSETKRIVLFK